MEDEDREVFDNLIFVQVTLMISFIFTVPSANLWRLRCSSSRILGMIISTLRKFPPGA